jgi:hypothetical protein
VERGRSNPKSVLYAAVSHSAPPKPVRGPTRTSCGLPRVAFSQWFEVVVSVAKRLGDLDKHP